MNTLNELLSNLKEKSDAGKDANRIIDFIGDLKKKELPEKEVMPAEDGKETFTYLGVLRRLDEKLLGGEEEPGEDPSDEPISTKVTVTFKNDDGSINSTAELTKGETLGIEPEPNVEEGYVFMGWSTDRYNPEYIINVDEFIINKDVTLWAMFEQADEPTDPIEDPGEDIIDEEIIGGDGPVDEL